METDCEWFLPRNRKLRATEASQCAVCMKNCGPYGPNATQKGILDADKGV